MRAKINLDPLPMHPKEIHFAFDHGQSRLSGVGSGRISGIEDRNAK